MPAPLSIVIPTLNSAERLGPTLGALKAGLDAGLIRELIISDGGSSDATEAIAEEVGAVWVTSAKGRGRQLAAGADAARGDWLLFLHSDTVLADNWAEIAKAHLSQPGKAGYFKLRFDAPGFAARFVAGWANLRARLFALPYGDQGLLISRALYDKTGGFAALDLMEDVDFARRLKRHFLALDCHATTGADRYLEAGWLRQGSRNLQRLIRFKLGTPVERLIGDYERG